jgi:hypothetical protein
MVDNFDVQAPAEPLLDDDSVSLTLENGARIEVWAKQKAEQQIDVLIHVHAPDGTLFKEEHSTIDDGTTVIKARDHGVDRAKRIAGGAFGVPHDDENDQSTPI